MKVGLNLFSIRTLIADEENFLKTALELKEMGYDFLQFSGAPYDAERIARVSERSGLPIVLTHMPMDRITNDTERLMEEHALFGCKNIGLGAMIPDMICREEECKRKIAELDAAGKRMEERGYKFFYHHHHFEFYKFSDGQTVIDYMLENAPHINLTLDTYWVQYGGGDVVEFIKRAKGRVGCIHLKDYRINAEKKENGAVEYKPGFAPVGDGLIDMARVIEAAKNSGAEYFFVEQDDAVNYADPIGQVRRSVEYLKNNF